MLIFQSLLLQPLTVLVRGIGLSFNTSKFRKEVSFLFQDMEEQRLPQVVGKGRVILSAQMIDAQKALDWGWSMRCFPKIFRRSDSMAQRIQKNVLCLGVAAVHYTTQNSSSLKTQQLALVLNFRLKEGVSAFLENLTLAKSAKRFPIWFNTID